jgi:hypothetical protein
VRVTKKGYSIELSLPEIGEFLCDRNTVRLAERAGSLGLPKDPNSSEYRRKILRMRRIIGRKVEQERNRLNAQFDIIIAVSNAPKHQLAGIKKLVRKGGACNAIRLPTGAPWQMPAVCLAL